MSDTAVFDPAEVEQFAGQLMSIYTGTMLNYMIDIGHRTGLFTAAANGAATSQDLADRAGLTERYVREWLAAMVTARIFDYDPSTGVYTMPAAHVAVLTDAGMNLAPMAALGTHLGKHVHQVARRVPRGRRCAVRRVPPRVHRRDGRRQPGVLRCRPDRPVSASRTGAS